MGRHAESTDVSVFKMSRAILSSASTDASLSSQRRERKGVIMSTLILKIEVEKARDDSFRARSTPIVTTVYAPDESAVILRSFEAMHLVVKALAENGGDAKIREYLSKVSDDAKTNGQRYEFRTLHVAGDFNNFDSEMNAIAAEGWEPWHYMLVNNQMTAVVICRRERAK